MDVSYSSETDDLWPLTGHLTDNAVVEIFNGSLDGVNTQLIICTHNASTVCAVCNFRDIQSAKRADLRGGSPLVSFNHAFCHFLQQFVYNDPQLQP